MIAINEKYGFECEDLFIVKDDYCLSPKAIDAQIKNECRYQ